VDRSFTTWTWPVKEDTTDRNVRPGPGIGASKSRIEIVT